MQRSFQQAGVRTIVSTLWPIADRATSLYMQRFYRNMLRDGMSKMAALREAQLWFLECGQKSLGEKRPTGNDAEPTIDATKLASYYALPSFWAPFVINGDWR